MSESEQDMKVRMGEAVSPEDADPCVIGSVTATMMLVRDWVKNGFLCRREIVLYNRVVLLSFLRSE
jgi:hypothetical protein